MVYRLHSIQLHNDAMGSAETFTDLIDLDTPLNPQHLAAIVAHRTSPTHASIAGIQPAFTFTSFALKQILDEIGTVGVVVLGSTNPGLRIFLQQIDNDGEPMSGSVHRSITIARGCLFPISLTAEHRANARLQCGVAAISSNGSAAPFVIADNAALPTISQNSERWTINDSLAVGGQTLTGHRSVSVAFGNTVTTGGADSNVYDTHIEEKAHSPTITSAGVDPQWLGASTPIPLAGVGATHANTKIYFRKRTRDGTHFVADVTTTKTTRITG